MQAHIARAEMGAHAAVHGLTMRTFPSVRGRLRLDEVAEIIAPDGRPLPGVDRGGRGGEHPQLRRRHDPAVRRSCRRSAQLCREHGVGYHLDGARLWNAHVATGVALEAYGPLFDTVSVCFSKGLGAPVGSVLVSTAENIARARVLRKRLGGGWRQAGMLAAAAVRP